MARGAPRTVTRPHPPSGVSILPPRSLHPPIFPSATGSPACLRAWRGCTCIPAPLYDTAAMATPLSPLTSPHCTVSGLSPTATCSPLRHLSSESTGLRPLEPLSALCPPLSPHAPGPSQPEDDVPFWKKSPLKDGLSAIVPPLPPTPKDERSLHVVHISAELAPIAKVGGLGDAVAGLASACVARGHHVECMLPFYECIDEVCTYTFARTPLARLHVFAGGGYPAHQRCLARVLLEAGLSGFAAAVGVNLWSRWHRTVVVSANRRCGPLGLLCPWNECVFNTWVSCCCYCCECVMCVSLGRWCLGC